MTKKNMPSQLEILMIVEGTSCIYALVDPRDHSVRYVGKSDDPRCRLLGHINGTDRDKNTHKANWIKKLEAAGYTPLLVILERVSKDLWEESEKKWIAHFRKSGARLTNIHEGGRGATKVKKQNRPASTDHVGVSKVGENRYRAFLGGGSGRVHLGYFRTVDEAISARKTAESEGRTEPVKAKSYLMCNRNSSGVQGVSKSKNRWRSFFGVDGKQVVLGSFKTFEEAVESRKSAENGNVVIIPRKKIIPKVRREVKIDSLGRRLGIRNTSGVCGVSYMPERDRWQAYIRIGSKTKNLGKFATLEEAVSARRSAESQPQ